MSKVGLTLRWLAVPLSFIAFNPLTMAAGCGPGAHWVDDCASGTDKAASSKGEFELYEGSCQSKGNLLGTMTFKGPTTIFRGDSQDALVGDPDFGNIGTIDNHNDVIKTELVSLKLTGSGFVVKAGDGVGNLTPDNSLYSPGYIQEDPFNPSLADSIFHIFFEISGPLGILHNEAACEMRAKIDKVPPLFKDAHPELNAYECDEIDLYDANNIIQGCLVHAKHELPVRFNQQLTAISSATGISLSWMTGYEEKMAGFAAYRGVAIDGDCSNNQAGNFTDVTPLAWKWSGDGDPTVSGIKYSVEISDDNGNNGFCYGLLATGYDGTWELYTVAVQ